MATDTKDRKMTGEEKKWFKKAKNNKNRANNTCYAYSSSLKPTKKL